MYLNPQDAVLHDDAPPLSVDGFTVRQESHASLNHADLTFGFGDGQTKTIAYSGPGHNVPKLRDILVRVIKSRALSAKSSKSRINEFVLWIGTSGNA
jgi:hypothetical protein